MQGCRPVSGPAKYTDAGAEHQGGLPAYCDLAPGLLPGCPRGSKARAAAEASSRMAAGRQLALAQELDTCTEGFWKDGYRRLRRDAGSGGLAVPGAAEGDAFDDVTLAATAPQAMATRTSATTAAASTASAGGATPFAREASPLLSERTGCACACRAPWPWDSRNCGVARAVAPFISRPLPLASGSAGEFVAGGSAAGAEPAWSHSRGPVGDRSCSLGEAASTSPKAVADTWSGSSALPAPGLPQGLPSAGLAASEAAPAACWAAATSASACSYWRCRRAKRHSLRRVATEAAPTTNTQAHSSAVETCGGRTGQVKSGRIYGRD